MAEEVKKDEEVLVPKYEGRCYRSGAGYRLVGESPQLGGAVLSLLPSPSEKEDADFRWTYHEDEVDREGPWIVIDERSSQSRTCPRTSAGEVYDPLESPELCLEFARLSSDEEILAFACKRGFLGRRTLSLGLYEGSSEWEDLHWTWGESLEEWRAEVARMRTLIRVWSLHENLNDGKADELLRYMSPHLFPDAEPPTHALEAELRGSLEVAVHFFGLHDGAGGKDHRALRERTKAWLVGQINGQLFRGTYGAIDPGPGAEVRLVPKDLLGAMHVQLALEVLGRKRKLARKCENPECGAYFPLKRRSKRFCSDRCKLRASRMRRQGGDQ